MTITKKQLEEISFISEVSEQSSTMRTYGEAEVKNEPQFFGASVAFALEHGGAITREFLKLATSKEDAVAVFDSRVHMLMPGMYPAIPGWHQDDVARTRTDGQPNHAMMPYVARHKMAIVGDASRTSFACGEIVLPEVPLGSNIYGYWHPHIETAVEKGQLREVVIESGKVYCFDSSSFHRANPATHRGWRWFGRLTIRVPNFRNEIRSQSQVYLETLNLGW
jgi:hypothetical protein